MKKLICFVITALLLVATFTFAASAANVPTVAVSGATNICPGEKVTLQISIENNPGFSTAYFDIIYDHNVFDLTTVEYDQYLFGNGSCMPNEAEDLITFVRSKNLTGDGVLCTITLEVKDSAEVGKTYPISVSIEMKTENRESIDADSSSGSVTIGHTPAADDGDCTTAVNCTVCGKVAIAAKGAHTPGADDDDCTTPINCTVCGKVTTPAKAHTPGADDGDCTTAVNCTVCGKVAIAAKAHTPGADDGDCTTAVNCTVCGKVAIAAKNAHVPGADDGDCTTPIKCIACNKITTEAKRHTPAADDGDCTTAVKCTVCGKVATAAKAAHTPAADDGDCTTPIKCTVCSKVVTEAKAHTPAADDGDCTTAVNCTVCGKVVTAANTHVDGDDKNHDCDVCGKKNIEDHTPGANATCTSAQICTECGAELVAKLNHTEVIDDAVPATCTSSGLTEGKHCSACGEVLVAQQEVPANGHTYDEDGKCVCGATNSPEVPEKNNWWWILLLLLVIAIIVTVIILVKKKIIFANKIK